MTNLKSALQSSCSLLRNLKYFLLSNARSVEGKYSARQPLILRGRGKIKFGKDIVFGVESSPLFFSGYSYIEARESRASVCIGDRVWLNNNVCIISNNSSIIIEDDVNIGWNVQIIDSDFHFLEPSLRREPCLQSAPIRIMRNALIYSNVIILKGVIIGENSIIAAGSVVTKSIPSNVVAAGIPAKTLYQI